MKNDQRHKDSIESSMTGNKDAETLFLISESDEGVRRNKGRCGARFAPKVILNHFLKLNNHLKNIGTITSLIVSDATGEKKNFEKAQEIQRRNISLGLATPRKNLIHLGGGHDHVYPLLTAIDKRGKYKEILIINIDAHCDTRVDESHHSGTPFRNFDTVVKTKTSLVQVGIHPFANSKSTLSSLDNIEQTVIHAGEIFEFDFSKLSKETFILLSLDADGLDSSIMKAVSAVNPFGIKQREVLSIIGEIKKTKLDCAFGIYEYNPLFDDLSSQGAKILSHLIYKWFDH
jgi:formiminoglutamase